MAAVLSWLSTTSGRASTICPATRGRQSGRAAQGLFCERVPHGILRGSLQLDSLCQDGPFAFRLVAVRPQPQQLVHVVEVQQPFVGQHLDVLGQCLDLLVGQLQAELLGTRLDRVPPGQAVGDRDVAGQAEVMRIERLIGLGRIQDGLGVDACLMCERAVAGDAVVEGDLDPDETGHQHLQRRAGAPAGTSGARRRGPTCTCGR